jgi:hypothetical protein
LLLLLLHASAVQAKAVLYRAHISTEQRVMDSTKAALEDRHKSKSAWRYSPAMAQMRKKDYQG